MRKINKYIAFFLLLLAILTSCNEIYDPEGLDSSQKFIVINGMLDDKSGFVSTTIFYASPFNDKSKNPVKKAQVSLRNNNGNSYPLDEIAGNSGQYQLQLSVTEINEYLRYYIHVETSEGGIYESEPQRFPGKIEITDLSAETGENTVVSSSSSGELITQTYEGLRLYISAKSVDYNKKYVRFDNNAVYQTQYWTSLPGSASPTATNCVAYAALSSLPIVEPTLINSGNQLINLKEIGFVTYIIDNSTQSDTTSPRRSVGWIVQCKAYSVNGETFDYYEKIKKQIAAENKILIPYLHKLWAI